MNPIIITNAYRLLPLPHFFYHPRPILMTTCSEVKVGQQSLTNIFGLCFIVCSRKEKNFKKMKYGCFIYSKMFFSDERSEMGK